MYTNLTQYSKNQDTVKPYVYLLCLLKQLKGKRCIQTYKSNNLLNGNIKQLFLFK